jgi:chemotaxis protein MotB
MEIPKGMKMIAKDFDQEIIATRIKQAIGKEIDDLLDTELSDLKDQIDVIAGDENVTIRLMGESTFDSGKADIRFQLKPLLKKVATMIAGTHTDIIIAGHTDNVPIHRGLYRNNLRLSTARAAAVAEYFLEVSRIDPKRISTMGFGEYRPIASNQTAAGRQKNRRVEIILGNLPEADRSEKY